MLAVVALACGIARGAEPSTGRLVRLVSLAPNLTELAFALGLGDRLVARSSACDYPPPATNLPVAGDFGRPNLERLLALRPDAVLVTDTENPLVLEGLRRRGLAVHVLPCEGWAALLDAAVRLAVAAGRPEAAAPWVEAMKARRQRLERRVAARPSGAPRPRVFVEIWADPLTTAGGPSFVTDLVQLAGGVNPAAGLRERYAVVSREWLLTEAPDLVVLGHGGAGRTAPPAGARLIDDIPADLLLRAGPRVLEGAEMLADRIETWATTRRRTK